MSINQLLAKALSTTSEEEAMSCLRMARKKGKTLDNAVANEYNGHGPKYWYDKANQYYQLAKDANKNRLTAAQEARLWDMYKQADERVKILSYEKLALQDKIKTLISDAQKKSDAGWWKLPLIALQFIVILVLVQLSH